jgi:hypothetical protein
VESLDQPDQPGEPTRLERAGGGDADRPAPQSRELPDPDERGRVYEATRAHVSAETANEASAGRRSYWDEVQGFSKMRADHEEHWRTKQRAAADRPADPLGSYRSDGGFYLNPARHAETVRAIGRVREAEPKISADVQAIGQENGYGGWLEGFGHRLKGEDRLKEKVAERLEGAPDKKSAEILRKVPDAIRFTFCLPSETYTRGYYDIKERLESRGHQMCESRNTWDGPQYKGINTQWVTPKEQRFEVQFHTPESHHAKEHVTHWSYERIRNPLTKDEERAELKEFQREVCSHVPVPDGARDIPDFKKEGF